MTRPERPRIVRCRPLVRAFEPAGSAHGPAVSLSLDELEALRLSDLLAMSQADGAARMGISRATFGRILERAHLKVARALIQGRGLKICGEASPDAGPPRGGRIMRLAIAITGQGNISQHFGQSHAFRIVDVGPDGHVLVEDRPNPHEGHHGHPEQAHEHGHGCGGHGGCGGGHDKGHGGGHGWLDLLADCQAAITLGIGGGALEGLRRRGVRPIVLERPLNVDEAVALFGAGRL